MTTDDLPAALGACATGIRAAEAGVGLLASNGVFLRRDDFTTRFIEHGTSDGSPMAAIDWDAAITALNAEELPCSGGERRILQLSASLAAGIPVSLRDTVTGIDACTTPTDHRDPARNGRTSREHRFVVYAMSTVTSSPSISTRRVDSSVASVTPLILFSRVLIGVTCRIRSPMNLEYGFRAETSKAAHLPDFFTNSMFSLDNGSAK